MARALAYVCLAALCGWLFLTRYWFHRDCIEASASSCVLPDGSNLIGGSAVWIVPAMLFSFLALREIWRWGR